VPATKEDGEKESVLVSQERAACTRSLGEGLKGLPRCACRGRRGEQQMETS